MDFESMKEFDFEFKDLRLKLDVFDSVYQPHEDTELLASEAYRRCSGDVLEVGCASGAVSICLAKKGECKSITAVDINQDAVNCTRHNADINSVEGIEVYRSDLFEKVEGEFDWILFNPPYLPTDLAQKVDGRLNYAFDGGRDGLETVSRFLEQVRGYLKREGEILLVVSSAQDILKINDKIAGLGFGFDIIGQKSFFFEKLFVYKLKKR